MVSIKPGLNEGGVVCGALIRHPYIERERYLYRQKKEALRCLFVGRNDESAVFLILKVCLIRQVAPAVVQRGEVPGAYFPTARFLNERSGNPSAVIGHRACR